MILKTLDIESREKGTFNLPKGKFLGFHMVQMTTFGHPNTTSMIGWTIGGKEHQKSSVGKITRPKHYSSLRLFNLGVLMGCELRPWV